MNICEFIQEKVAIGEINDDVSAHLRICHECKAFADDFEHYRWGELPSSFFHLLKLAMGPKRSGGFVVRPVKGDVRKEGRMAMELTDEVRDATSARETFMFAFGNNCWVL